MVGEEPPEPSYIYPRQKIMWNAIYPAELTQFTSVKSASKKLNTEEADSYAFSAGPTDHTILYYKDINGNIVGSIKILCMNQTFVQIGRGGDLKNTSLVTYGNVLTYKDQMKPRSSSDVDKSVFDAVFKPDYQNVNQFTGKLNYPKVWRKALCLYAKNEGKFSSKLGMEEPNDIGESFGSFWEGSSQ